MHRPHRRSISRTTPPFPTRWVVLAVALPFLSGCYTYTRITPDAAPVGQDVRLVVTGVDAPDLLTVTDPNAAAPTIKGQVTGRDGESLMLRVPVRPAGETGTSVLDIGQMVRVPVGEILSIERQDFSGSRTGFLLAGALGAGAFVVLKIIDTTNGDDPPEGPDPDVLFSLFRIPIG